MSVHASFLAQINKAVQNESFVKLSLGNYKGEEPELKNIYVKPVLIKRELKLSFTYRYQRRDIVKNYTLAEAEALLTGYLDRAGFRTATLFTTAENRVYQLQKSGEWTSKAEKPTNTQAVSMSHDHQKERKISSSSKSYLHELRLTDADGKVYKNAQDKWKQINHYIELLSTSIAEIPAKDSLKIVDMGAGKGYLTFALYDYLNNELKKPAAVEGVEYREDLVTLCNEIAANSGMNQLKFVQGTIEEYEPSSTIDILIALHACDTATDDAIYKGIVHEASLIVVAPCCHKQIRRELEQIKPSNDLDFMTKHGIFLERHAEMLTDSIRALLLEYAGYQTKVMQFISDAHTPKNAMIIAVKKEQTEAKKAEIAEKLQSLKSYFGIRYHHLEKLMGLVTA